MSHLMIWLPLTILGTSTHPVCLEGHLAIQNEYRQARAVILGRVIGSHADTATSQWYEGTTYIVAVERTFRGAVPSPVELFSENSSGRFPMDSGLTYLLFVYEQLGRLAVDNCGNSGLLSAKSEELRVIEALSGNAEKPREATTDQHWASVPQIICPEMDEGRYVPSLDDKTATVDVDSLTATKLAFYGTEGGWGVVAPRGWHCLVGSGTARTNLVVTPGPIDSSNRDLSIAGPAVEIDAWNGGTSGRFEVAILSSRFFPRVGAPFVDRVRSESLTPDSEFRRARSDDVVTYSGPLVARVTTPRGKRGFGTEDSYLAIGGPIYSVAVLDTLADWELYIVRIRLAPSMSSLEPVLLRLDEPCGGNKDCQSKDP